MGGLVHVLVTILLYKVRPSEGVRCYICDNVAHSEDCAHVGFCGADQKCATQRIIGDSLNDYFKVGCIDKDVCSKSSFNLFGSFGVGKRSITKAERSVARSVAMEKRQNSDDLMVTCLQCCDGDMCNKALCGAIKTDRRRCFECSDVDHPRDCERIVECGRDEECFTRLGPLHQNWRYAYTMSCMTSAACRALTGGQVLISNGCTACCNDTDYCNFQVCNGWTPPTTALPNSVISTQGSGGNAGSTAPQIMTTAPQLPPPTPIITGNTSALYTLDIHLKCSLPGSVSALSTQWFYNKQDPLPPLSLATGGALDLYNLNETNAGKYTCMTVSKTGIISTTSVWVTILDTPPIVISVIKSPPVVSPGQQFTIMCSVIGYPKPKVTWQFLGKDGSSTIPSLVNFSSDQKTLTIQHYANSHHDGTWTCTASNFLGHSQAHVDVP